MLQLFNGERLGDSEFRERTLINLKLAVELLVVAHCRNKSR